MNEDRPVSEQELKVTGRQKDRRQDTEFVVCHFTETLSEKNGKETTEVDKWRLEPTL